MATRRRRTRKHRKMHGGEGWYNWIMGKSSTSTTPNTCPECKCPTTDNSYQPQHDTDNSYQPQHDTDNSYPPVTTGGRRKGKRVSRKTRYRKKRYSRRHRNTLSIGYSRS